MKLFNIDTIIKTRIKIIITKDNKHIYVCQKRNHFIYPMFMFLIPFIGWYEFFNTKYSWINLKGKYSNIVEHNNIVDAKTEIDRYIKYIEEQDEEYKKNIVKEIKYVDYDYL